jgi:hypothetical protein
VQARAGAVEDALFDWLDQDHDRRLTARELATAGVRLGELDRDTDAVVTVSETPERYACVFLRGAVPEGTEAFGPMAVAPPPREAMPPWLAAMDTNGDQEVSAREFLGTAGQFAELDADGDGFLDAAEVGPPPPAESTTGGKPPKN